MSPGWLYCMFVVLLLSLAVVAMWAGEVVHRWLVRRANQRERERLDREYGA